MQNVWLINHHTTVILCVSKRISQWEKMPMLMREYPGELATLWTCYLYTTWQQKRWLTNDLRSVWQWNYLELKAYLNYYQQWKFNNQRFNKCFDAVWPNGLKSKSHSCSCTWAAESGGKIQRTFTYGKTTHVESIVTPGRGWAWQILPSKLSILLMGTNIAWHGVGQNALWVTCGTSWSHFCELMFSGLGQRH